jgi:predicted NBD/HSP70 family sugar kinase
VNLLQTLQDALQLEALVENNANAAALGALYSDPTLPRDCIVYLKLGTGCGGATIINGRLLRGASGTAAELGHIRVSESGPLCSCGQRGCLESHVNIAALSRAYRPAARMSASELVALPTLVVEKAGRSDVAASRAIETICHHLATGIQTLVNTFNPSTVILGGAMSPVVQAGLDQLRAKVTKGIVPGMKVPELRLSGLGEFECAIGAATLAHHRAFDISAIDVAGRALGMSS